MPVTHDMVMHLNQMQGFYNGLASGRPYPRWQENTNGGFGAPTTLFYPPAIYYLTSLLYLFTGDWLIVIKSLYLLLMIGSGVSMFVLARRFYSHRAALLSMCAYVVMPYHLLNHYQRGAIAECLAFVWIPLTLVFVVDLLCQRARRNGRVLAGITGLALSWGLFVWSHPPTAFQFLLIAGPLLLGVSVASRAWRELVLVGGALLLGLAISAAYLLPAVVEQRYVHAVDVERTWPYHESYVLSTSSPRYDHRSDDFVVRVDRLWLTGFVGLVVLGLSLEVLLRYRRRERLAMDRTFRLWLVMALYASFMMLSASKSLGGLVPGIEIGVFAWRLLAITGLAFALLFGHLAEVFIREGGAPKRARRYFAGVVLAGIGAGLLTVSVTYVVVPMYRAQAFAANPDHSNYSLVPIGASREPPRRPEVTLVDAVGKYSIEKWDPEDRLVHLDLSRPGVVSFRTFNFPGWTALAGARPISINTGSAGEVTLDLAEGTHEVALQFRNTSIRSWGWLLSCFGVLTLSIIFVLGLRLRLAQR